MPKPRRPWFRFYVEAMHDTKIRTLSTTHRWLWVVVLGAARQSPRPGYLMVTESLAMSELTLSDFGAMRVQDVRRGMELLRELGMVEREGESGVWFVPRWSDRQFETDDVTERTRKHRSNTPPRNVPTSSVGTRQRTETETEVKEPTNMRDSGDSAGIRSKLASEAGAARRTSVEEDFETIWSVYPRHREKPKALKAYAATRKRGADPAELLRAAIHYRTAMGQCHTPLDKMKYPATFFGPDRHWAEWVTGNPEAPASAPQSQGRVTRSPRDIARADVRGLRLSGNDADADKLQAELDAGAYAT